MKKKLPPIPNKPKITIIPEDTISKKDFQIESIDKNNKIKNKILPKLEVKDKKKEIEENNNKNEDNHKHLFIDVKKNSIIPKKPPHFIKQNFKIINSPEMSNFEKNKILNQNKNLDIEIEENEGDETINEIMKDVTFQSNNKEEKSQNNIPQKNNQKTSEKGIIAIKRKIQKSMLPTKFGGEHYIYCTQMFSYPTYQIKQLSTITGGEQKNKQAQMAFTTIGNKKLLNHLSEDVWGKKYSNSDIYKRNAHINHVYYFTKKAKKNKKKKDNKNANKKEVENKNTIKVHA